MTISVYQISYYLHDVLPLLSLDGSLHDEQPWQEVDENSPDPGRHQVSLRRSEVDVENHHGDADTEGVEDHGEEDKLAEEGHHQGGGRDDLGQQEEEHSEREQDGDGERDLLARVRGQVEDEHGQERDAHARDDDVDGVEQRLSPQHLRSRGDQSI